ncbi:MAG: Tellurite resistance methyltransferase TehB core [Gammaproteobacteria bacterium]|nr:MAG: Tellurite resistance methyltransferase TehB core [Gammaproteobacteria bacterium]TND04049.1 MAG: Tellurite resistance methyltransferase, TehB, core [Gammaproteobacteria bacterium]
MNDIATQEKWDRIYAAADKPPQSVCRVLEENAHLLPAKGTALDLACGLGANAFFLAENGLKTLAWDISPVAVRRVEEWAQQRTLPVQAEVRDVLVDPLTQDEFDVIVVAHFLDRSLVPHLINALKPGGLLFYQTFTRNKITASGPSNAEFLLSENELLRLFAPLSALVYRDEGRVGDITRGMRSEAMFVGQKVAPR